MSKKKKKYKVRWKRFLVLFLIIVVITLGFLTFYDPEKNAFVDLGYTEVEIENIRNTFTKEERDNILKYEYLSFLDNLTKQENYKQENLTQYIEYILNLQESYELKNVVYLVNEKIEVEYSKKLTDIINSEYFIKSRLERYLAYNSESIEDIITNVNANLDYEFYTNTTPTDISKGNLLLVNKYYYLEKDYYYGELVTMESKYDNKNGSKLNKDAYEAFKKLVDAAELEGYHIRNNSAYRSYDTQLGLYNSYKASNGNTWADKWSARAGHSEHQTGLALDVGVKNEYVLGKFASSREFVWMKDNAHKYGFILRYPEGKEYITGYGYEPWHYRYVGESAAAYIYENDITFEEYYAYFVENQK